MNLVMEFRVSIFERFLPAGRPASPLDRAVETVLMLAVDLKAFALFSLLFGVGLAIQFEHLSASPRRALLLFRRLIVLLMFGLFHLCLIWNGDILTEYALAGLIVLPFLFGPRWLLAGGAAAFLGVYLAMQEWPPAGLFPSLGSIQRDIQEANQVYPTGSYGEVLRSGFGKSGCSFPCTSTCSRAPWDCFCLVHSSGEAAPCENRIRCSCSQLLPAASVSALVSSFQVQA